MHEVRFIPWNHATPLCVRTCSFTYCVYQSLAKSLVKLLRKILHSSCFVLRQWEALFSWSGFVRRSSAYREVCVNSFTIQRS